VTAKMTRDVESENVGWLPHSGISFLAPSGPKEVTGGRSVGLGVVVARLGWLSLKRSLSSLYGHISSGQSPRTGPFAPHKQQCFKHKKVANSKQTKTGKKMPPSAY